MDSYLIDTLIRPVAMGYLKKGDLAFVSDGSQRFVVIVDMDGHIVSPNYGTLFHPERGYHATEDYINVKLHAFKEQYRGGSDTTNRSSYHYNDTLHQKDGWMFFVDKATAERVSRDKRAYEKLQQGKKVDAKLLEVQAEIQQAQDALAVAQLKLASYNNN